MAQDPQNGQVFMHPSMTRPHDDGFGILPAFPVVAATVDTYARRIPWWMWAGFGLLFGSGVGMRLVKRWTGLGAV